MSTSPERTVLEAVRAREPEMLALLDDVVSMESPSRDADRQTPILARFADELSALGLASRIVRGRDTGDHLFCRGLGSGDARQLVVGHIDTVWPMGTLEERPLTIEGGVFRGPGAFDMKGGLVQLMGALWALGDLGCSLPCELIVFINSDEEIGSPDSRRWIRPLARRARRAFVLEGAFGQAGALKVGRKGVGRYEVRAKGRAAHAGLDPESGASAILELTHQIQALFALNDPATGVTVNVGTIDGGLGANVIAPEASAQVDVRVYTSTQAEAVDEAIRRLQSVDPDVRIEVAGGFGRPPMERNAANEGLAKRAQELAAALGLAVELAVVGGASDGNLTSQFIPTLDGLGAVGDGAHRIDEHVLLPTLPERAALLALLLLEPLSSGEATR